MFPVDSLYHLLHTDHTGPAEPWSLPPGHIPQPEILKIVKMRRHRLHSADIWNIKPISAHFHFFKWIIFQIVIIIIYQNLSLVEKFYFLDWLLLDIRKGKNCSFWHISYIPLCPVFFYWSIKSYVILQYLWCNSFSVI